MSIKFLVLGGGGLFWVFLGGGGEKCRFYFYGRADFSEFMCSGYHQLPYKKSVSVHPLEGPTRKPRHASVFSMHSDTQAVPSFHCIRMFKGIFSTRAFLKRTDTLSTIA